MFIINEKNNFHINTKKFLLLNLENFDVQNNILLIFIKYLYLFLAIINRGEQLGFYIGTH